MANKVHEISIQDFKKKFAVSDKDPFKTGIFSEEDLNMIRADFGILSASNKVKELVGLVPLLLKEPGRILTNFSSIVSNHLMRVKRFYSAKSHNLKKSYPFSDYALKANIIAAFKPKRLLEIGTFRGFGITVFKSILPNCKCSTMSPKVTKGANNEVSEDEIGKVFKSKKIDIEQIWSDSLKYNYKLLKEVDVSYIDGNHKYKWAYSDLVNCNKITKKMIILDDYIPSKNAPRGDVAEWGWWNEDVVKAVSDFIKKNPTAFKEAYWLKGTPICVLVK